MLQEGEDPGNQKHIHFCSPHDIRALGILSVYNLSVNLWLDSRKLGGRGALLVRAWKCQNWPMKVSKDQYLEKSINV